MKYKKQISLLLTFFILVSNIGFAFNVHYCGDEIASVSLKSGFSNIIIEDDCCKIEENQSNCCIDKVFKVEKNTVNAVVKSSSFQYEYCFFKQEIQLLYSTFQPDIKSKLDTAYYCDSNAPPLFKLYNQYIFYDQL